MKQGVLANTRVRLLLREGVSCYRPRRVGERKRKSVRGCIVGADLAVLNLVIVKKGEADIAGLTETATPRRLGPKRASKIRKLFNLSKAGSTEEEVKQLKEYAYKFSRQFDNKKGKKVTKFPKIQRLVEPVTLKRKKARFDAAIAALTKSKEDAAAYKALVIKRVEEQKEARRSEISKRRSSRKASMKE